MHCFFNYTKCEKNISRRTPKPPHQPIHASPHKKPAAAPRTELASPRPTEPAPRAPSPNAALSPLPARPAAVSKTTNHRTKQTVTDFKHRILSNVIKQYSKVLKKFYISKAKDSLKCILKIGRKVLTFKNVDRLLNFLTTFDSLNLIPREFKYLNKLLKSLILVKDIKFLMQAFKTIT